MNKNIELFKKLIFIRRAEELLADEYRKGMMRTPTHFGIGQEAIAVGVCEAMEVGDVSYTHHRSHTHYLAKGGSLLGLIAELFGREDGCSRGRGGSVHIVSRDCGFLGSSPILGHSVALATGSALSFKLDEKSNVAVAFFGEGAFDEGAVWESFNYAAVKRLPVLFVCENNQYATESPMSVRVHPKTNFCEKARSFGVDSKLIDGNNLIQVYSEAQKSLAGVRGGNGPFLLECMTYRWREHVGPLWDYEVNRTYRSKQELDLWMARCPILSMSKYLLDQNVVTQAEIENWYREIDCDIHAAISQAEVSPWPKVASLFDNAF